MIWAIVETEKVSQRPLNSRFGSRLNWSCNWALISWYQCDVNKSDLKDFPMMFGRMDFWCSWPRKCSTLDLPAEWCFTFSSQLDMKGEEALTQPSLENSLIYFHDWRFSSIFLNLGKNRCLWLIDMGNACLCGNLNHHVKCSLIWQVELWC